jgi:FkbM family methyltransferase
VVIGASFGLKDLLDTDRGACRSALDARYRVVDEVLAGSRRAIVYPAARMGRRAAARLIADGVQIIGFGDGNPSLNGTSIDGLPVLGPAEIAEHHRSDAILVASTMFDSVICAELRERGCELVVPVGYLNLRLPQVFRAREYDGAWHSATDPDTRPDIEAAFALLADDESRRVFAGKLAYFVTLDKARLDAIRSEGTIYFEPDLYELGPDEVVADGGAFDGDTLLSFLGATRNRFASYHAFEPDSASFQRLAAVAATDPARITAVRAGLADGTSSGRVPGSGRVDSRLLGPEEPGGETVELVSLDDYFEHRRPPSLVKLDIEGFEAKALEGARSLISRVRPVLAVSAYHFPKDLWTIPLLIARLAPDSRLFLRHYTREVDDTVCYAIARERLSAP